MRTVATIYWDRFNGCHHTLVCDVEENGAHSVLNSTVHDNSGHTLDKVISFWTKELGESNVRAYTISEYVKDVGRYTHTL
jgi:tRNA A37 threonylcarbamoyltransferase TsaD